ncbi:MAG: ATP-binding protein, partial [Desulfomonilaceae bacterium]
QQAKILEEQEPSPPLPRTLRVLVVGSESDTHVGDVLQSLTNIGHEIVHVHSIPIAAGAIGGAADDALTVAVFQDIQRHVMESPPDLVIQTKDQPELFRLLCEIMPPKTRLLDSLILRIVKGLKDISGQLIATRTRLQTVELMKEVLTSGPEVSLMVVDEDLKIVEISNSVLERGKMVLEDCIGRPCHWVLRKGVKPCDCAGDRCIAREVLLTGKSVHTVKEATTKHDSKYYFTVSAYPMKTEGQEKMNVLVVWKDIHREMTRVLDQQAHDIQQNFSHILERDKMVALGQLAAAAVHEINNPIQGILTFAKLMRQSFDKDSLDPEELDRFRSYLDLIAGESARCGQILRNLLAFARLDNMEKTAFDLNRLLDEIFMLIHNRASLQGITLERRIAHDVSPIFGDRGRIKQALLNLVINAMDAMPRGGVITVEAHMEGDNDYIRILVKDTGVGIPKGLQGSIWEPFVTTKAVGKGVGLGLSVVYGIVTQHGGTVDMQSEENKGTVFGVNLPVFKGSEQESAGEVPKGRRRLSHGQTTQIHGG